MSNRRYVYMNYAQQEIYYCASRDVRYNSPRRSGKTHSCLAPYMHRVQKSMPRGGGIFLGNNRKQVMARTIPAVTMSWNAMWGLREGENYVFGKPPAKLNYPDPIYKPKDWANTISFANGFVWSLVSLAVTGSANGLTTNAIVGDEAKFWSKEKLDSEVMPCLSGIVHPYGDESFSTFNPFYKSTCFVSDASLSSKGNWLEREEAKMDIPIESGPNKGKTSRELKAELLDYARRIIDYNDIAYRARKTGHEARVVSEDRYRYAHDLLDMCRQRTGRFHVLPKGDNSKENCAALVKMNVLTQEDADLLYNAEFLITEADYLYARLVAKSEKYQEHLRQLKRDCFGYWQGSTLDNVALLSEDYIKRCKRDLPPLVFAISILGIKMKRTNDGFYYAFDAEGTHGYIDEEDNGVIDLNTRVKTVKSVYAGKEYKAEVETPDFDRLAEINDCRMDGDLRDDDELCIAFDYNSRINWCVVGVVRNDPSNRNASTLYVINSLYVKGDEKIETLLRNFCRYYAPHRQKNNRITLYWDSTAKSEDLHFAQESFSPQHPESFADTILRILKHNSWDVRSVYMGDPISHNTKYTDINNGLKGLSYPAVRINREKNEALIVSIENAGVKQGYGRDGRVSIQKDKSGEKLAYNPDLDDGGTSGSNVREEWRTDGSDAFDTLYIGIKYFRYGGGSVFGVI